MVTTTKQMDSHKHQTRNQELKKKYQASKKGDEKTWSN